MKIFFYHIIIGLCVFGLSSCAQPTQEPDLPNRPAEALATGNVTIEMPRYIIAGQPNQIKLRIIGAKTYAVHGDLLLSDLPYSEGQIRESRLNDATIFLSAETPEAIINFTPSFSAAPNESYGVTAKFKGNDSDNFMLTTVSQVTPKYAYILDVGMAETIKANSDRQLNVKTNKLLETQVGNFSNFVWTQTDGPQVQLTKTSDRDLHFIAPDVSEITKLRFRVDVDVNNVNEKGTAEKLIYVVPTNNWIKVAKTFDDGAIVVREDGSAIASSEITPQQWLVYSLTRPLDEIKDMIKFTEHHITNSADVLLILYVDGTLDVVEFDTNGIPEVKFGDIPRAPLDIKNGLSTQVSVYRGNNLKAIKRLGNVWEVQSQEDQFYRLDYDQIVFASPERAALSLSEEGILTGSTSTPQSYGAPFSVANVRQYSEPHYSLLGNSVFAYLFADNSAGYLRGEVTSAAALAQDPSLSVVSIHYETISKSPYQLTPFIDISVFGKYDEIYLLEQNGSVSSFHKGAWNDLPYFHNIAELGTVAVSNDGTAIVWQNATWSVLSVIGKVYKGVIPSPFNVKATGGLDK
jgi:hypothetical protein